MKVVFLSPAAQGGGAEAALIDLIHALHDAQPQWNLHLIVGEDGPLLGHVRALGVPCEVAPFPPAMHALGENGMEGVKRSRLRRLVAWVRAGLDTANYVRQLRARLRELQPDALHSNGMKMHLLAALAKPSVTPLIWHLHEYLGARSAMRRLLTPLMGRCQLVVANSESVAVDARRVLPAALPVRVVHNAIDLERFQPAGNKLDLDALAGMPSAESGTVRVGLVGAFAFWKGHEVFFRAATRLLQKKKATLPPMRFYVIGGPVYATTGSQRTMAELRGVADHLGLNGYVGFTGFVDDAPAAMRALDIVVHASTKPEPFGLVIVQAMACERAVVASAAGGAQEIVADEINSLTHAPGDVEALANAIGRLVSDASLRARIGAAGRLRAEQSFARAQMGTKLVSLYENLFLR